MEPEKISSETVRADFNDVNTVVHYARAAHFLGLWKSERLLIARFFPELDQPILEAGCGAGRVTIGLHDMGYSQIWAFDFAEELLEQAQSLALERGVEHIRFFNADATRLIRGPHMPVFAGVMFLFNGLMQIPGRENRRTALRQLATMCKPGAPLMFTTHDRNVSAKEQALWRAEAERWATGEQDPRLVDFGDRYFEDDTGRTFMHLPDRREILEDLAASGWEHVFDELRREVAAESRAVREFSDECRFWVSRLRCTTAERGSLGLH